MSGKRGPRVPRFEVVGEDLEVRVHGSFLTPVSPQDVREGDLLKFTYTPDDWGDYHLVHEVRPTSDGFLLSGVWMKDRRDSGGFATDVNRQSLVERVRPDVAKMVVDYLTMAKKQYFQARHPTV